MIALRVNTGQDLGLDSITGYSHWDVPHYPRVSSSASLDCVHILLLLFHLFTSYLLLLVAPGLCGYLGLSQVWSQECYALPMQRDTGQKSSET